MTTHKKRANWFQSRTCFPFREAYPPDLDRKRSDSSMPVWQEVGPLSSGGRLSCLAVDPRDPNIVWAGAAAGGVWRSEDRGLHWKWAWGEANDMPTLNIGSLAISPSDPDLVYCGTGEANLTADNYPGTGIFFTRDKGATWKVFGGAESRFEDVGWQWFPKLGLPRRIGSIAVDPRNPHHVFAGGVSHSEEEIAGLFEKDPASPWWEIAQDHNNQREAPIQGVYRHRPVFISRLNYFCHAVAFHPSKPLLVAAVEARGTQSGIWISEDNGLSWRQASHKGVLPEGDQFGRVSIALSPSSEVIWALAGQQGTREFLAVFRSKDLGKTWERMTIPVLSERGQMSYTNCIAVHPTKPHIAIAGTLDLHRTKNGGRTWQQISSYEVSPNSRRYVHEDHHAIAIGADNSVYVAHDGGFSFSPDLGDSWETRNNGLAVSMFYGIDVSPFDSNCISGGLQDMGIWFKGPLDTAQRKSGEVFDFRPVWSGDGGWTCYDPRNEDNPFASRIRMDLFRHQGNDEWDVLATEIPDEDRKEVFQTVVTMTYGPSSGPPGVYMGSTRLWESLDNGDTWHPLSNTFDGSVITAIEVAVFNGDVIYVGTENGGFFRGDRVRKGSKKFRWSRNLAGPSSPGRTITRITTNPLDEKHVFFCVGSIAETAGFTEGEGLAASTALPSLNLSRGGIPVVDHTGQRGVKGFDHVYESKDGGRTWDHTGGLLPNVPHNAVLMSSTGLLFAAHDSGVAVRFEGQWYDLSGGLPRIRVTDLALHETDELLFASTYGRGVWKMRIGKLNKALKAQAGASGSKTVPVAGA